MDFAWCHPVIQTQPLQPILAGTECRDLSLLAEIVLAIREEVKIRYVDGLALADPFIHARAASRLKMEGEQSRAETCERLNYVVPMLQLIHAAAQD